MRVLLKILILYVLTTSFYSKPETSFTWKSVNIFNWRSPTVISNWYVSLNGSGSANGLSSANSWSYSQYNSLGESNILPGDSVSFNRGETYYGAFVSVAGTSGNNVRYGTYGSGAKPKISAFTTLSSWTLSSGNIYYATLNMGGNTLRMVTLDGARQRIGRYPNTGYLSYESHSGNSSITDNQLTGSPSWTGAEVVIRKLRWVLDRHPITNHSTTTLTYSSSCCPFGNNSTYDPVNGNGYFIQNALATLDQEGEWWHDPATNRVYMHFGSGTPTGRTVKASNVEVLNYLHSYTTYNNIEFEGGREAINAEGGQTHATFYNCDFNLQSGGSLYGENATYISMAGCTFSYNWNTSFLIVSGASNTAITNCTFNNNGNVAGMGQSGDGGQRAISVVGNNTDIRYNTVTNTGYHGISFIGNDVLVEYNFVDTYCTVLDDGGGIYTYSANITASNRIIRNNIVLNAIGAYAGAEGLGEPFGKAAAIYYDGYSNHTEASNNILAHGEWGGIFVNGNDDNTVTNNTTYDFEYGVHLGIYVDNSINGLLMTGNKLIAKTATQKTLYVDMNANNNPSGYGTINNNIYARPLDNNESILVDRKYLDPDVADYMNVTDWITYSTQDDASTASAITTALEANLKFDYNATSSTVPISLSFQYKDVAGTLYSGSTYNLLPYTGKVLVYFAAAITNKVVKSAGNKVYKVNGKITFK